MKSGSGPGALFAPACRAFGRSTLLPRSSMGGITMKMMSRTSTPSTRGVTLMSDRTPSFVPTSIAMVGFLHLGGRRGRRARRPCGRLGGGRRHLVRAGIRQRLVEAPFLEEEVDQLV